MDLLARRSVEFAMLHTRTRAHALHTARTNNGTVAHIVHVRQCSLQHITDDLHITVTMSAETASGLDSIIVNDAQRTKPGMFGVVVIGKRKAVPGIQPAVIGMAAFLGSTYFHHRCSPSMNNKKRQEQGLGIAGSSGT